MRQAWTLLVGSLAGLSLVAGCPDRSVSLVIPQQGRVEYKDIPVNINRNIDILFLIDNSSSMLDKQTNLKANFPNFVNVLNTIPGGLPDIHLGVATSDLGSKGADDPSPGPSVPGCAGNGLSGNLVTNAAVTGPFISDTAGTGGTRQTNYTGTLSDAFSALASVGANGCGFEQHLEAVKRALDNNPANTGFLRSDAYLAVVILGDEDDCSIAHSSLITTDTSQLGPLQSFRCTRYGVVCDNGGSTPDEMNQVGPKSACHSNESKQYLTDVQRYVDFLKGLKPDDPTKVIVADIGAPPEPVATELRSPDGSSPAIPALAHSCSYVGGDGKTEVGDPTVRVNQFLSGFPNRSTFSTICQQDLSGALTQIGELLRTVIGSPCIDGKLATPYDCSVSDVVDEGKPTQKETILPECNNTMDPTMATNTPCWAVVSDPMCTSSYMNLTLKVFRGNTQPAPDTHVVSYCVTVTTCSQDSDCGADQKCDLSSMPGTCVSNP